MTDEDELREAARTLGRLGGAKGGRARAAALTPKQRSDIARKAANARWAAVRKSSGTTRKCPICGKPYKVHAHSAADQSACPECVRKAEANQ